MLRGDPTRACVDRPHATSCSHLRSPSTSHMPPVAPCLPLHDLTVFVLSFFFVLLAKRYVSTLAEKGEKNKKGKKFTMGYPISLFLLSLASSFIAGVAAVLVYQKSAQRIPSRKQITQEGADGGASTDEEDEDEDESEYESGESEDENVPTTAGATPEDKWGVADAPFKMLLCVNMDLRDENGKNTKMKPGKAAAQSRLPRPRSSACQIKRGGDRAISCALPRRVVLVFRQRRRRRRRRRRTRARRCCHARRDAYVFTSLSMSFLCKLYPWPRSAPQGFRRGKGSTRPSALFSLDAVACVDELPSRDSRGWFFFNAGHASLGAYKRAMKRTPSAVKWWTASNESIDLAILVGV